MRVNLFKNIWCVNIKWYGQKLIRLNEKENLSLSD